MPDRKKELSMQTRFFVLGLVCSLMIGVLCIAAFSSGFHATYQNPREQFAQPDMQIAATQPAASQARKRGEGL